MRRAWHRAVVLAALAAGLAPEIALAQAGPPLLTDDPGTPGDGRWEINLAGTIEWRASGARIEAPVVDLNYGLGERIQLKYEVAWVLSLEPGEGARSGLGNSEVGVKWRFLDEEDHGVSMSVYPQLAFNNPSSSSHERGLVEEGLELALPVQVSRALGPFELTLEVGYVLVEGREDEWLYGFAAAWSVTDAVELLGEVHGSATRGFTEDVLVVNLGAAVQLHEHASLRLSAGHAVRGAPGDDLPLLGYLGVQITF